MPLLIRSSVGCSVRYFLTLPLEFGIRRYILWPNSPLGYEVKALACFEDTLVCGRSYPSRLRDADGRNSECPQLNHEQYRRVGVQLASGYAGSTPGMFDDFRSFYLS